MLMGLSSTDNAIALSAFWCDSGLAEGRIELTLVFDNRYNRLYSWRNFSRHSESYI